MLRKSTDEDISNEELETIINPFYDNYHNYVEEYVMPEVIAFYIASSFYRNAMWEATFLQHYNSASDMFNLYDEDYEKTKAEVIKLLRIKYSLEIISEDPLDLKKNRVLVLPLLVSNILFIYAFSLSLIIIFSKKLTENYCLCVFRWQVGLE